MFFFFKWVRISPEIDWLPLSGYKSGTYVHRLASNWSRPLWGEVSHRIPVCVWGGRPIWEFSQHFYVFLVMPPLIKIQLERKMMTWQLENHNFSRIEFNRKGKTLYSILHTIMWLLYHKEGRRKSSLVFKNLKTTSPFNMLDCQQLQWMVTTIPRMVTQLLQDGNPPSAGWSPIIPRIVTH